MEKLKNMDKKMIKKIGIIAGIVVIAIIAIILIVNGVKSAGNAPARDAVSAAVEGMINSSYVEGIPVNTKDVLIEKLDWSVSNYTEKGETATFVIVAKNINVGNAMQAYSEKVVERISELQNMTEEDFIEMFASCIELQEVEENTAEISMTKNENGEYEIDNINDLYEVLIPGLI